MNDNATENPNEHCGGKSELIGLVMREGYCCDCENNNPETSVVDDSKIDSNPCNGCWFVYEKPNWKSKEGKQYCTDDGTLMNGDGTRSIFDDVDA